MRVRYGDRRIQPLLMEKDGWSITNGAAGSIVCKAGRAALNLPEAG